MLFCHGFSIKSLVFQQNCCIWRIVLLITATSELEQPQWQKPQKLFGRFLWHCCLTNIVKHDRKYGNAIVALVPKIIVVSSITIVASSISSEIPVERFFNHIRGHFSYLLCTFEGLLVNRDSGLEACGTFNAVTYRTYRGVQSHLNCSNIWQFTYF